MEQFERDAQENLIKTSLANDPDLKFDDPNICTYEKKLEQLYEFEDDLLREDRILKENRRGLQTICRMTGGTQSYFLFDAEIMQIAREIYYELVDSKNDYANLGMPGKGKKV